MTPIPKKPMDSLEDYLTYFERVAKANSWSDAQAAAVFPACLEVGSKVLDGLSDTVLGSFKEIKKELAPEASSYKMAVLSLKSEKLADGSRCCKDDRSS